MEQRELPVLLQSLTDVAEVFSHLGQRLETSAQALQTTGRPPERSLINEIMAARQNFADLRTQGYAFAESLAITPLAKVETFATLGDLKALIERIMLEEERKTAECVSQRAMMVLNRICTLRHSGFDTFAPLVECHARAAALRDEIATMSSPKIHPRAEAIVKEEDAFSALLTLTEHWDKLDDESCSAFQDVIGQTFGKPLAVAALRGKLVFSAESPSVIVEPEAQETQRLAGDPSAPSGATEQETETESASSPRAESVMSVSESIPPTESPEESAAATPIYSTTPEEACSLLASPPLPDLNSTVVNEEQSLVATVPLPTDLPPASLREYEPRGEAASRSLYRFAPAERSQKIATLLLSGTNGIVTEKPAILRDLVWRLIFEERVSLAFHVARSLETHYPEVQPRLPAWILRAVVLGQRIRTPRGEIARMLKEDFAQHHDKTWVTGNPEWDVATELLLIAASLSPALLAPETGAAKVLHDLCLSEQLPHLASYCETVARYGDQLVPLNPSLLKKSGRTHPRGVSDFVRLGQGKKESEQDRVETLRQEVANLSDPVKEELRRLCDTTASVPTLGGVACCQRALEQVRGLFDEDVPFLTDEPLPRPLLNADLSRIPSLVMNKQGEIEGANQPTFADSILRLVASGAAKML